MTQFILRPLEMCGASIGVFFNEIIAPGTVISSKNLKICNLTGKLFFSAINMENPSFNHRSSHYRSPNSDDVSIQHKITFVTQYRTFIFRKFHQKGFKIKERQTGTFAIS